MKKLLMTVTLILICLLAASAVSGEEASVWEYEINARGLVIKAYTGNEESVFIPDQIDGYKVSVIGRHAFKDNTTMREITIPSGIVSIDAEAFYGCVALAKVNFNAVNCVVPDIWIHDNKKGGGVFAGAGSASPAGLQVVFGDSVTKVPDRLFMTASSYPYVHVTEAIFSDNVREIGANAFNGCQDLSAITFGEGLQVIDDAAFCGCSSIRSLRFTDALQTLGVSAFENCALLSEITWGSNLGEIGSYAFKGCSSLTSVTFVSPLNTISRQAFADCIALREVTIPETVTHLNAEAFYGCIALTKVNFNAVNCVVPDIWVPDDTKGGGVFAGAGSASPSGLQVIFGDSVTKVPDRLFLTASSYPYAHVTEVIFSESVKEIGANAFNGCQDLIAITFGEGLQVIDDAAFCGCSSIRSLRFTDALQTLGVSAFENCASLNEITWGDNLGEIGSYAFKGCSSLTSVTFISPLNTIGRQAFADCIALREISIPESLTHLNAEAFYGCSGLARISFNAANCVVPDIWVPDDRKGGGVFAGAGSSSPSGLQVVFGDSVTKVPDRLFLTANSYPYAYITETEISASVQEIGSNAFGRCEGLQKVTFFGPDTVAAENAFEGCTNEQFCILAPEGSTVIEMANQNGIRTAIYIPAHSEAQEVTETLADVPGQGTTGSAGTWTCGNGHEGNTGNFCPVCGLPKPVICPGCGYTLDEEHMPNYCPNCGFNLTEGIL